MFGKGLCLCPLLSLDAAGIVTWMTGNMKGTLLKELFEKTSTTEMQVL